MEPEVDAAILRAWLSGESIGREGAMNIPSLAGCLNKIAGTMAAVPIKLYKREDDRITEVTDGSNNPGIPDSTCNTCKISGGR